MPKHLRNRPEFWFLVIMLGAFAGLIVWQMTDGQHQQQYKDGPKPQSAENPQAKPSSDIVIEPLSNQELERIFGPACEPGHFYCEWGLDSRYNLPTQASSPAAGQIIHDLNVLSLDSDGLMVSAGLSPNKNWGVDPLPCDSLGWSIENSLLPEIRRIKETGIELTNRLASTELSPAESTAAEKIASSITSQLNQIGATIETRAAECGFTR